MPPEVYAMYLYTIDISEWHPRSFRVGKAEQAQMAASLSGVQRWWKDCLDREYVAIEEKKDYVNGELGLQALTRTWKFGHKVPKKLVYQNYQSFCNERRLHPNPDSTWAKELRLLTNLKDTRGSRDYAGLKQPHCYIFGELSGCRDEWTKKYGEQDTEGWHALNTFGCSDDCPEWTATE